MSTKQRRSGMRSSAAALVSACMLTGAGLAVALNRQTVFSTGENATPASSAAWTAKATADSTAIPVDRSIQVYPRLIQPIFIQNCIMCHGVNRQKGHLRLDTYQYVMYGKYGHKVVLPGDPNHSILIRRITLPAWNHHRMPPHGHAALTKSQILLLKWWIQTGAGSSGTLASLHAGRTIDAAAKQELQIVKRFMPQPIARIKGTIRRIEHQTGVQIHIVRSGLPWLSCDASGKPAFNNHDLHLLSQIGSNIVVLNIGGTGVTDAGLPAAGRMVNLMYLHLEHTSITNTGLDRLTGMGHLRYLNVTGTRVTAAGVNTFKRNNRLWRLWVAGLR